MLLGSVAGHIATPDSAAYCMSKFAVRALAESFRGDLQADGIGVTLVSPGFVHSDIRRTDNTGGLHADAPDPVPAGKSWARWNAVARRWWSPATPNFWCFCRDKPRA
jgi:NAD(P)-dependent dehydrogenase (short-subunit alcohol dehydrogenase family)